MIQHGQVDTRVQFVWTRQAMTDALVASSEAANTIGKIMDPDTNVMLVGDTQHQPCESPFDDAKLQIIVEQNHGTWRQTDAIKR